MYGERYLAGLLSKPEDMDFLEDFVRGEVKEGPYKNKRLSFIDYEEALAFYDEFEADNKGGDLRGGVAQRYADDRRAFLACNDRYYLLVKLLHREDLKHPWLYDRCREVEREPYGFLDLWARAHGKSSIITTGGIVQEIIRDPEVTVAIFSATRALAHEFLGQIKNEFETNDDFKRIFSDVLYENPRGRSPVIDPETKKILYYERPAKWSLHRGITVKRKGHPKEATVEAHGLIDGQPTGRHFPKHYYDDLVTQDYLSEELMKKTTQRFELADNLGTRHGSDKCIAGTRYHFADTYGVMQERGIAKPRIYPATRDATLTGELVLLTPENWDRIKRTQGMKTTAAQMLLNPLAGNEATFSSLWLRGYDVIPRVLNVYILVDPSKGTGERSDRTAIAVIGIDVNGNKYLLDGYCHRMKLTERHDRMDYLKAYWEKHDAVVKVGYERYGMLSDVEVIQERMLARNNVYEIIELNTPRQGGHSKNDRIERLEPDIRAGRFYLPCVAFMPDYGKKTGEFARQCYWSVWTDADQKAAEARNDKPRYHVGQIIYRPVLGLTRAQQEQPAGSYRIVRPLKRLDENKDVYDVTRVFIEEMVRHPFAPHDDFIDACSRIYDIEPRPPVQIDAKAMEGIDVDDTGIIGAGEGTDYDD